MILTWILIFLFLFIIWLFFTYNAYIWKSEKSKENIIEKFDFTINIDDIDFENKVDEFIRNYINSKYSLNTSSKTYKEIYEILGAREDIEQENIKVIDSIFSLLIVNKYSSSKLSHREDIIKSINNLEK